MSSLHVNKTVHKWLELQFNILRGGDDDICYKGTKFAGKQCFLIHAENDTVQTFLSLAQ